MYRLTFVGDDARADVMEYVCDNVAELPTNCGTGSIAYCFSDKKYYILNFENAWVEM